MEYYLKKLGINIDHIATLRNARGDFFPSLVYYAGIVEVSGGDFITVHLREDRRHVKDEDVILLNQNVTTFLNLEMACNEDVLSRALEIKPHKVTLVPERREEQTTEGGLNLKDQNNYSKIKDYVSQLQKKGIIVSLFIEPDLSLIDKIIDSKADEIEIHTGHYSLISEKEQMKELEKIKTFSKKVYSNGIKVCAGHGLTYHNTELICTIKEITELNIGYSIISRSITSGLSKAVSEMKKIIKDSEE